MVDEATARRPRRIEAAAGRPVDGRAEEEHIGEEQELGGVDGLRLVAIEEVEDELTARRVRVR